MKVDTKILEDYREHTLENYKENVQKIEETLAQLSKDFQKGDAKSRVEKAEAYVQGLVDLMNQHMLKAKWFDFEDIKGNLIAHGIKLSQEDDGRWFWNKSK